MQQISLYSNQMPFPNDANYKTAADYHSAVDAWVTAASSAQWGWIFDGIDTGLVFASRDAALVDAQSRHPGEPVG